MNLLSMRTRQKNIASLPSTRLQGGNTETAHIFIHEESDITFSKRFHNEVINIFRYMVYKGLKRACFQICIPHIWALTTTHLAVSRTIHDNGGIVPLLLLFFMILSIFRLFFFFFYQLTVWLCRFPLSVPNTDNNVAEIRQQNITII